MTPGKLLARVARSSPRFPGGMGQVQEGFARKYEFHIRLSAAILCGESRSYCLTRSGWWGAVPRGLLETGTNSRGACPAASIRAACVGVELAQSASESALVETWPTQEKVPGC